VVIAIKNKVIRFDLATKECIFTFQAPAKEHMQLYDNDGQLLVSDEKHVKLWNFFEHNREAPELVTILQLKSSMKERCIKVNKRADTKGETKGMYFYVITDGNQFKVYQGRLDLLIEGEIGDSTDKITCIEFGSETKTIFFGTQKGTIVKFEIPSAKVIAAELKKEN